MIKAGAVILVPWWVPPLVVGTLHPGAHPIGLGLPAWAGSLLDIGVAAIGGTIASARAA